MKKWCIFLVSIIFMCLICNNSVSFASSDFSISEIPKTKEIAIPYDFKIHINYECRGHLYFLEADANQNGNVVILSHQEHREAEKDGVFKNKFIDIYNPYGEFVCEIAFTTEMDPVLRIEENNVYLIFYNNMLTFDIDTEEFHYYIIPGDEIWQNSNNEIKQNAEFSCGEWNYKCNRNFLLDFVELTRYNNESTEIIYKTKGDTQPFFYSMMYALPAPIIYIFIKKHLKKVRSNQGKRYVIDGFYELDDKGKIKLSGFKRKRRK